MLFEFYFWNSKEENIIYTIRVLEAFRGRLESYDGRELTLKSHAVSKTVFNI